MVYVIEAKGPSKAWLKAVKCLYENGERIGELKKEVLDLVVEIEDPLKVDDNIEDIVKRHIGAEWVSKGANLIFPENPPDVRLSPWHKTYWTRLRRYEDRIDQLDFIVRKLRNKPKSKQLFCTTFDPLLDIQPQRPFNPTMPCLTALDFKFRNAKLYLFALFRSHDFGRKAYGNYIGLGRLLEFVCKESNHNMGKVIVYSRSAHIRSKEFEAVCNILSQYDQIV